MANTYKRRWGDRRDGRLLHSLDAFTKFIPFIMKTRNDASNQFSDCVEITELDRWLRKKRAEGWKNIGLLHVFLAAYTRVVATRPAINRFVNGQRIYARNNVEIVMAVKRTLTDAGSETTIKVELTPQDTIFDIYRKLNVKVDEIKADDGNNNTEQVAETLCKLPRIILRFAIWALNLGDYFGLLPKSLLDASPFHGSMIITDLGSLRIGPVYHHIYNFGTLPVFIAFGAKRHAYEMDRHGEMVDRKYVDTKFVLDEGIADGHYYAQFLQAMRYIFQHPEIVETPPSRVVEDIF